MSKQDKTKNDIEVDKQVVKVLDSRRENITKELLENEIKRINHNNRKVEEIEDMESFVNNLDNVTIINKEVKVINQTDGLELGDGRKVKAGKRCNQGVFNGRIISESPASLNLYEFLRDNRDKHNFDGVGHHVEVLQTAWLNQKKEKSILRIDPIEDEALGKVNEDYPIPINFPKYLLSVFEELDRQEVPYMIKNTSIRNGKMSADIVFVDKRAEMRSNGEPLLNSLVIIGLRTGDDLLAQGTFGVYPYTETVWCENGATLRKVIGMIEFYHHTINAYLKNVTALIFKQLGDPTMRGNRDLYTPEETEVFKQINPYWSGRARRFPSGDLEKVFYDLLARAVIKKTIDLGNVLLNQMQESVKYLIPADNVDKEIDALVNRYGDLTQTDGDIMKQLYHKDPLVDRKNFSQYYMAQLVTSLASSTDSGEKMETYQELGGKLFGKKPITVKITA